MSGRTRHRAVIGPTSNFTQAVLDHLCPPTLRTSAGGISTLGLGCREWNRGAAVRCVHGPRDHPGAWGARFIQRRSAGA